jgi:uncharacterized protein (TIGR02246 family)
MYHPGMTWSKVAAFPLLIVSAIMAPSATPEASIRGLLADQAAAWNRGDLVQFVSPYAKTCTLVGHEISRNTRAEVLAHYRQKYPSSKAMGTLDFSDIGVQMLDPQVAIVTGHWHLAREAAGGGAVGGLFSLVFQLTQNGWQIVLDHTSEIKAHPNE